MGNTASFGNISISQTIITSPSFGLTGNTAGSTTVSGNDIYFSGGNNITLSVTSNTIVFSGGAGGGAGVSQLNGSQGTLSLAVASSLSASTNGSTISFGLASNITTALQSAGTYLTTAALSNHSHNFATTTTNGNLIVVATTNSNGATIAVPSFLTTARASNDAIGLNTAQTNVTWTVNSNGLSLNASGYAGTNTTFNGANISGSITLNSNGLNLSLSAPTPGGGGAINVSAGTTSGNLQTIQFNDSNGLSFGLNGSILTASHNGITSQSNQNISLYALGNTTQNSSTVLNASQLSFNGLGELSVGFSNGSINLSANVDAISAYAVGNTAQSTSGTLNVGSLSFAGSGGASVGVSNGSVLISSPPMTTLSTYEPYPSMGLSTVLVGVPTATSAAVSLYPFVIEENVSAGVMNMAFSMAFLTVGTSSGRQTMGMAMALYSRNVSTLSSIVSTSFSMGVTGNNSSYTINQVTQTNYTGYGANADTNSAGSNISSGYTGMKLIGFPINKLLTPGNYWIGMIGTNSTSSVNVGISMSHLGAAMGTGLSALAPIGSFSSAFTSGQNPLAGRWNVGQGSWSSAGSVTNVPSTIAFNSISAVGLTYPLIKFWST